MDLLLKSIKECCNIKSVSNEKDSDLKSIYLDGELPHDSKILVSGSETTTEKITHEEDDSVDDEAVKSFFCSLQLFILINILRLFQIVLSGKMTISLISLNYTDDDKNAVVDKVNPSPTPAAN